MLLLPLPILTCPATNPQKWKFLTLKHWAADPRGTWRLSLKDTAGNGLGGRLSSWELILHGAATNPRVDPGCSAVAQSGSRGVVEGVGRDQSRPTCTNPPMAGGSRLCAPGCIAAYLGNGVCDAPCNNTPCALDSGDCGTLPDAPALSCPEECVSVASGLTSPAASPLLQFQPENVCRYPYLCKDPSPEHDFMCYTCQCECDACYEDGGCDVDGAPHYSLRLSLIVLTFGILGGLGPY